MELPQELRFENLSKPHSATMYTQKTSPVSFSQDFCRFEIPKQGILNSTGIIEFSFTPSQSTNLAGVTYPVNIGCFANIERAVMTTSSGKVIMDNRNFAEKQVCEEAFRDGSHGHFLSRYMNLSNWSFNYTSPLEPVSGYLRLSGVPQNSLGEESLSGNKWSSPPITTMGGTVSPVVPQSVRVSIQQLFPFLYGVQLPVNIMETLYIDIYWKRDTEEGKVVLGRTALSGSSSYTSGGVVNQDDCFLISDHMVYDDSSVMEAIKGHQMMNGGLSFPFRDYVSQIISTQAPESEINELQYERELGSSRYKLTDIRNIELINMNGQYNPFLGKYYSNGNQIRDIQLTLNDSNYFPDNDKTQMENYTELSSLYENVPPYIPRVIYATGSTDQNSALPNGAYSDDTEPVQSNFNGLNQRLISGQPNLIGINLKDSEGKSFQNGNQPIRMYYKKKSSSVQSGWNTGSLQYFFIGFERAFSIANNGNVLVSEYS